MRHCYGSSIKDKADSVGFWYVSIGYKNKICFRRYRYANFIMRHPGGILPAQSTRKIYLRWQVYIYFIIQNVISLDIYKNPRHVYYNHTRTWLFCSLMSNKIHENIIIDISPPTFLNFRLSFPCFLRIIIKSRKYFVTKCGLVILKYYFIT